MKPITLHFTEGLLRRAVRAFWWQGTGWSYVVSVALCCAWFAFRLWSGDRSWVVGMLGALLAFVVVISAAVFVVHSRASLGRFRRMRVPEATLELGEERFRLTSDLGASEIGWNAVTGVRRYPEFWLLYFSRSQFVTFPTADLPDDARALILAKVKELKR
jgi:hypothetical protein